MEYQPEMLLLQKPTLAGKPENAALKTVGKSRGNISGKSHF